MGARVLLPADGHEARLQLVVRLGELLDQASGGAGVFLREGVQQGTGQLILDDGVIGVLDCTRDQGVLRDLQVHAFGARLLPHAGQLLDGQARVLRGNQRVRRRGDLGQFGNDFLLLVQIESHCTSSVLRNPAWRVRAGPVLWRHHSLGAGDAGGVPLVAVFRLDRYVLIFGRVGNHLRRPVAALAVRGLSALRRQRRRIHASSSIPARRRCHAGRACGL